MPVFKDASNREWLVKLDGPTLKQVREECKVNLVDLEGKAFEQLNDDPVLLVDCLWVICRDQARQSGISDRQFGESLVGDAIESATAAMLEAIAGFFPVAKRSLLLAIAEKTKTVREAGLQMALARLEDPTLVDQVLAQMQAKMDAEIRSLLNSTPSSSATNSPGSSESTQPT